MLQRYKLRLGDGTVLLVDLDGLNPWLNDRQATVQAEGSRHWRPVREVVARERVAARRRPAVHETPPSPRPTAPRADRPATLASVREDGLPLIPPPPKKTAATTTPVPPLRADGLPLVPPPPRTEALRREGGTETPAPREAVPPQSPAPRHDGAVEVPPPDASIEIGLGSIDPGPILVEERPDLAAASGAAVEAGAAESSVRDEIVPAALPPEPALVPPPEPASGEDSQVLFEPASLLAPDPPEPGAAVAEAAPAPAAPASRVDAEPPPRPVVFEEIEPEPAAEHDLPPTVIVGAPRPVALEEGGGEPLAEARAAVFGDPDAASDAAWGAALGAPEGISATADEPRSDEEGRRAIEALPVIPFKKDGSPSPSPEPAPSAAPAARASRPPNPAAPARPSRPPARRAELEEAPAWVGDTRVQAVLRGAAAMGGVLSRGLTPINRLERGEPPLEVEEGALTRARTRAGARLRAASTRIGEASRGLVSGLRDRLARDRGGVSPVPSLFDEPEADAAAEVYPVARPKDTEAGAGVPAPGRVADLTVIPLADAAPASDWSAEDVAEDVYGGPGLAARFRAAWQWTARTAFLAALLAFVAFTAVTWETWFPQAAHVGEATFHEIDRHARARELAEQQNRVLAEAKERLPYLTPETVRLILSHSPTGVLEIPDIFEAACDAADWGSWALTGPEAEELEVLRRHLFGTLAPIDRGRVAQYEEARENGLVFPLDNRLGALMWARGARALGPDEQERLRELLGKAVAAGLTPGRAPASATYRP